MWPSPPILFHVQSIVLVLSPIAKSGFLLYARGWTETPSWRSICTTLARNCNSLMQAASKNGQVVSTSFKTHLRIPSNHVCLLLDPPSHIQVVNPFQSILFHPTTNPIRLSPAFSLPLQYTPITQIAFKNSIEFIKLSTHTLSIEKGIGDGEMTISSFGQTLLLHCHHFPPSSSPSSSLPPPSSSSSLSPSIPPFFPLHCSTETGMISRVYSIRAIVTQQNGKYLVYKRLFPTRRVGRRVVYDVHSPGTWIQQDGESVKEVCWKDVQHVCPLVLQYESSWVRKDLMCWFYDPNYVVKPFCPFSCFFQNTPDFRHFFRMIKKWGYSLCLCVILKHACMNMRIEVSLSSISIVTRLSAESSFWMKRVMQSWKSIIQTTSPQWKPKAPSSSRSSRASSPRAQRRIVGCDSFWFTG